MAAAPRLAGQGDPPTAAAGRKRCSPDEECSASSEPVFLMEVDAGPSGRDEALARRLQQKQEQERQEQERQEQETQKLLENLRQEERNTHLQRGVLDDDVAASMRIAKMLQEEEDAASALSLQEHYNKHHRRSQSRACDKRRKMNPCMGKPSMSVPAPPRDRHFVGDTFYLTHLEGTQRPADAPFEIEVEDVMGDVYALKSALLTSYGISTTYISELLHDAKETCLVTVVDHHEDHVNKEPYHELDERRHGKPPREHRVMTPMGHMISVVLPQFTCPPHITLVFPRFHDIESATAAQGRGERGTMHSKLMVLEWDSKLRVSVASRNLGGYESHVTNCFWVHDFERRGKPGSGWQSVGDGKHNNFGTAGSFPNNGSRIPGLDSCVGHFDDEGDGAFARSLRRLICEMLALPKKVIDGKGSSAVEWELDLMKRHLAVLDKYVIKPPAGVHFITSVPGAWTGIDYNTFGHLRMRAILDAERQRAVEDGTNSGWEAAQAVEIGVSSLARGGIRTDFIHDMERSLCGQQCANDLEMRKGQMSRGNELEVYEKDVQGLSFVFPSFRSAMKNEMKSRMSRHEDRNTLVNGMSNTAVEEQLYGMKCVGWYESSCPKHCFRDCIPPLPHREHGLYHSKIFAGLAESTGNPPPSGQTLCRWVYCGSHNWSGAAWGVCEEYGPRRTSAMRILSYEAGILIVPPEPSYFSLPWVSPAPRYQLAKPHPDRPGGGDVPWNLEGFRERLHGKDNDKTATMVATCARQAIQLSAERFERYVREAPAHLRPSVLKLPRDLLAIDSYGDLTARKQIAIMVILASEREQTEAKRQMEEQMCCMLASIAPELSHELDVVIWPCLLTSDLDCHTDVLTIALGLRAPSLVVRSPGRNGTFDTFITCEEIFRCTTQDLLEKLRRKKDRMLANPAVMPAEEEKMKMAKCEQLGRENAEWVRENYDLILFDTEGVIKYPDWLLSDKSFIKECRPFFNALTVDETGAEREDAPHLAVVSNFGTRVTDSTHNSLCAQASKKVHGDWAYGFREGKDKPWKPQAIRDEMESMFADGEWVNSAPAYADPDIYISYFCKHPKQEYKEKMALSNGDDEWSESWSMPNLGMIRHAINKAGVHNLKRVLMLAGSKDSKQAAQAMNIDCISHVAPRHDRFRQQDGQGLWFAPGQKCLSDEGERNQSWLEGK